MIEIIMNWIFVWTIAYVFGLIVRILERQAGVKESIQPNLLLCVVLWIILYLFKHYL